ncbi:MAG: hypothetical protein OEL69_08220 [Nitrosopumilus sp.]|jgi:hypothetical protein|nr:hypothetical protein [Nitrosopumilus sp.]
MGLFLFAIGIAVATALLSSMVFQFVTSNNESPFLTLEEKCEKIALEGYKIHVKYPESQLDELPIDDMNKLLYLDELWINDCVNGLPAATIFDIVQRAEFDFYSGE